MSSSSSSYPDHSEFSSSFFVSTNTAAAERNEQEMLPAGFSPHEHSVVCGRGKRCINAPGNQRLKIITRKFLQKYAHTKCKKSKAVIVADIIDLVRSECPNGRREAFVRFHQNTWFEVDELGARQKVTTVMRDGLHTMYKSSSKSKVALRRTQKVLGHLRQESVPTSTILEPVALNGVITKNYQKTQDRFQRTVPKIICDQNDFEEGILGESLLEPIALHVPSRTFFDQQHQEKPPSTATQTSSSSSSSRLQDAMQRHRKLLGHLEQAERALAGMFDPLEPTPIYVASTPSFNFTSKQQDGGGISVVTPPAFRSNMFDFFRTENHGEGYASSCSSNLTGVNDHAVAATPAPFHAPFPVNASFDIDTIFD
jgi:hypothetical protein